MTVNPNPNRNNAERAKLQSDYVLEWLNKLAAGFRVELSEETQAIYLAELCPLPQDRLERAMSRTLREWMRPSQMPPLGFILERLDNSQLEAEMCWESTQQCLRKFWHPDIGFLADAPHFTAAQEYAVRQAGGLHRIHNATDEMFGLIRRDFMAAFQRFSEERGGQLGLSRAQSEKFLSDLQERRHQLPAAPQCSEAIAVPKRVVKTMSGDEHMARLADLRRQAGMLQGLSSTADSATMAD